MRRGALFRWIEEAEARQILEVAILQKAVSDPYIAVLSAVPVSTWQIWLRSLRFHARGFNGRRSALVAKSRRQEDGQSSGSPAPLRHTTVETVGDIGIEVDAASSILEQVEL
jgi:hypothetical protein